MEVIPAAVLRLRDYPPQDHQFQARDRPSDCCKLWPPPGWYTTATRSTMSTAADPPARGRNVHNEKSSALGGAGHDAALTLLRTVSTGLSTVTGKRGIGNGLGDRPQSGAPFAQGCREVPPAGGSLFAWLVRLPEPMLARPGPIPTGAGWRFEPKLDGFRCLVCTHDRFRARSRRAWDMTQLLPELEHALPRNVQLDGELVAFDPEGRPDFQLLSRRMLHRQPGIPVTYMVFDVLAFDGEPTTREPYRARRQLLEALKLESPRAAVLPTFPEGDALFAAMCERGLEVVVAKRERDAYRPGERVWIKTNRGAPRFAEDLAGARRR